MAHKYDLFPTLARFLDPQLSFALLEFASSKGIYDPEDVLRSQIELLDGTNMVDFAIELYKALHKTDTPSKELLERKQQVLQRQPELQQKADPITQVITVEDNVKSLKSDRAQNSAFLQEKFGIGPEQVDALHNYGKLIYDSGDYETALELLSQFSTYSMDAGKILSSLWGKLACEILLSSYDHAMETLDKLREAIDAHLFADALRQLQQRTWMLHWANFVFWNLADGPSKLVDLFLQDRFTVALQVNAPHLLRYLVAAHLVTKGKKEISTSRWLNQLDQLRRTIMSEEYQYSDPITDFVKAVYCDYDFERAQRRLKECEVVISNDYFLQEKKDAFMEQARMSIFEVYCRIHQCINLSALAEQMGMGRDDAEVWIAQLIRSAQLDAKIDSTAGTIVMGTQYVDPLDAIVERTNNLSLRTFKTANAIIDAMSAARTNAAAAAV